MCGCRYLCVLRFRFILSKSILYIVGRLVVGHAGIMINLLCPVERTREIFITNFLIDCYVRRPVSRERERHVVWCVYSNIVV